MKFDGFDMKLNGCKTDNISIYKDKDGYYQFDISEENPFGKTEFNTLLSRDELIELKAKLELLILHT